MRDIIAEAVVWRKNLRPINPLIDVLADMEEADLVGAYQLWWQTYTNHIRNAPTVGRPEGVSESDAKKAGASANAAVIENAP